MKTMKKTLFIFCMLMASCTPEDKPTICDCNAVVTIDNVPNGESYYYGNDCNDNGKVLLDVLDTGFRVRRIVKCD
jgi:hypothetical protein